MSKYEVARNLLERYNQNHVLNFYHELTEEQKEKLLDQILSIDFEQISNLYNDSLKNIVNINMEIAPISYVDKMKLSDEEIRYFKEIGIDAMKKNEYSVCTMAGGQGTRLGHSGPKGTYRLGINPDKTLFEILCDTLKDIKDEYNVIIPWYIMTSKDNRKDTIEYFEKNNYLDYPKEYIRFFNQGEMPMILDNGKIIMKSKFEINEAANGHGGVFEAMYENGILDDMKSKGIRWVYIGGVDNVLSKMVDPILLGLTIDNNMLLAGKSLIKAYPEEKVGVFCKKNNRPSVIEYTEISKELSELRDENGDLIYGESHILCNLFSTQILENIAEYKLPYHIAHKKSKYIDENGNEIIPTEANAYKFETFIFDAFERLNDMMIFRVKREEEFAPVKNAEGIDSPETARKLYNDFWNK